MSDDHDYCTGLTIGGGVMAHHACPECGHRADAHGLHQDGMVSCDVCAILRAVRER